MFIISRTSKSGGEEYLIPARFSYYRWAKRKKKKAKLFMKRSTAKHNAKKYEGELRIVEEL